jgi:hypothetical protein
MRALLITSMLFLAACSSQAPYPAKSAAEVQQLIHLADVAFNVAQKVYAEAPAADVQEATRELPIAVAAAQGQIEQILKQVADVDHLAKGTEDPMAVSSCIRTHLLEIEDIERMSATTRMNWSMDVGQCAAFNIVYFKSAPPADSSVLALALSVIDPVLLVAKSRGGLKHGALAHYLEANDSILAKLGPQCEKSATAPGAGEVSYQCAAYQIALTVRPKLQALIH